MKALKYSRQRESIKSCLMARHDHPTADMLYTSMRKKHPHISLGTIYRNLNLLVDLGEIQKLSCGDGKDHFDAKITPHYHFLCRHCGDLLDLPMAAFDNLEQKAAECLGGRVDSHTIYFCGDCPACLKAAENC